MPARETAAGTRYADHPTDGPGGRARQEYETNRYQVSEGGRLFRWIGCDECHTEGAAGALNLADTAWRTGGATPQIYQAIAQGRPGMPAYAQRLPPQQIWQLAGYVHGLNALKPEQRRRNAAALEGEPSGSTWRGPLR